MIRLLLLLVMIAGLILACSKKESEGILTKDEMAAMLVEFYLREARMKTATINEDSAAVIFSHIRQVFSKKTGFDESMIDRSYNYYLARPAELQQVYTRVIDTLALREQRGYSSTYQ